MYMFVVLLLKWVEKLEYTVSGLNTQRLKEQWDFYWKITAFNNPDYRNKFFQFLL